MKAEKAQQKGAKPKSPDNGRPHASNAKRFFFLCLIFALAVTALSFFKKDGYRHQEEIDGRVEKVEQSLKAVKKDNKALRQKIRTIDKDSYQVEKFAREQLHLVKENEVVFRFKETARK
jgi:cell division protein FtsB